MTAPYIVLWGIVPDAYPPISDAHVRTGYATDVRFDRPASAMIVLLRNVWEMEPLSTQNIAHF